MVSERTSPLLFTRDGHTAALSGIYRGQSAFLVCSGPSLVTQDLSLLRQRGIVTLAVNNAATIIRPQLWVSVDDPGNFCDAIWRDPGIWKFIPQCHLDKPFTVRRSDGRLVPSSEQVGEMPCVFGYRRNDTFVAERFLYESTFNWGNHAERIDAYGQKGSRSMMYVALRLLFHLGFRRVFLLGCDFKMERGKQNYAFEQDRSPSSVRGNNSSYKALNVRLKHLKPYFDREGFEVLNCTPNSGLRAPAVRELGPAWHSSEVPGKSPPQLVGDQQVAEANFGERRGRDSNPGTSYLVSGFQDRCNRPLCHLSGDCRSRMVLTRFLGFQLS